MLHEPKLLLLDEPTAGVDPKARRDFWDEIHALAAQGITVLVSTHYMDEAERCHDIAYIAYGELIARGTADEVVEQSRPRHLRRRGAAAPTGWRRELREHARRRARRRRSARRCTSAAPTATALEQAIAPLPRRPPISWSEVEPTLEDVFIHLMGTGARTTRRA